MPTGQTGIMIAGWGISIDRVISDFAAGAAEQLVLTAARDHDLLIVEGQGGISHPAYAPVTLALLYGSAPDALILVHDLSRSKLWVSNANSFVQRTHTYVRFLCSTVKPARVVGIALNTSTLVRKTPKRPLMMRSSKPDCRVMTSSGTAAQSLASYRPRSNRKDKPRSCQGTSLQYLNCCA